MRSKETWGKEPGKNILRTAGFVATGVGAVALVYKGVKWLFGSDEEEEKEAAYPMLTEASSLDAYPRSDAEIL